ncbi:response regulator [Myxococcota bacterium]|nr:response regulator [Myxococcota bacterium]MBU1382706.1 response regulator [Myxococcota bacterium]MBU1496002.1 response regulator [Myxococcota bacterium]
MIKKIYVFVFSTSTELIENAIIQSLEGQYEPVFESCSSFPEMRQIILEKVIDLIVIDYSTDQNALREISKIIRDRSIKTPVLTVGESITVAKTVKAIKDGSDQVIPLEELIDSRDLLIELLNANELSIMKYLREEQTKKEGKRYHNIFHNSPLPLMLLDGTGFFDLNEAALKLFNYKNKIEFLELHPSEISPETQIDGTSSFEAAEMRIAQAIEKGSVTFEWVHRKKTGEDFLARVYLNSFDNGNHKAILAHVEDISHEKEIYLGQVRRERLLKTISSISTHLLSHNLSDTLVNRILEEFAISWGMIRAYLVQNQEGTIGELYMNRTHEFTVEGTRSIKDDPYFYMIPYGLFGYEWINALEEGKIIALGSTNMTDMEREFFSDMEVTSSVLIPLQAGGKWFGFLGADDITHRNFTAADLDVFHTLGAVIGNALNSLEISSQLRERERQLEILLQNNNVELWEFIPPDRIEFRGHYHNDFISKPSITLNDVKDIVHEDDLNTFFQDFSDFITSGKLDTTYRVKNTDGQYRWIWSTGSLENCCENKQQYAGFSTDLTIRKEMEKQLESTLTLVTEITENIDEIIIMFSGFFDKIHFYTPNISRFEGIEAVDFPNLIHPEDLPAFKKAIEHASISKHTSAFFRAIISQKQLWFSADFIQIPERKGECRIIGVFRDETEKHDSQVRLMLSEEKYRNLLDSIPDVIVKIDPAFNLINSNKSQFSSFEKVMREYVSEEGFFVIASMAGKTITTGEELTIKLDFKDLFYDWRLIPESDNEGKASNVLIIGRDITAEEKLKTQIMDLQGKFIQSQKMEVVGALAGGIAYNFNNILTCIHGNTQLAMMEINDPGSVLESLEEIKVNSEYAATLVRQLLTFSKVSAPSWENFNLSEKLHSLIPLLSRLLGDRIQIETDIENNLFISGDTVQIEQVILNIALRARDAMQSVGKFKISLKKITSHHFVDFIPDGIEILCSDNGDTPDQNTTSLFEPFKATGKGTNTGLGLSTVKTIINKHYGTVDIVPLSPGASFRILLPVSTPENLYENSGFPSQSSICSILIIEDEYSVRQIMCRILSRAGFSVFESKNGTEALDIITNTSNIDLVLCDMILPDMDGGEILEIALKTHPDLKFLFTSGHDTQVTAIKQIITQGHEFLPKPFTPDSLIENIKKILKISEK